MKPWSRSRSNDTLTILGAVTALVAVVVLVIWWNVSVWTECRQTNSWMYCVRVLSK